MKNSKKILISAGPTREHIDPVRYISNMSSGTMGYALAEEAKKRGHEVVLVSGPTNLRASEGIVFENIVSARELEIVLHKYFDDSDILFMTSAVCDYRPAEFSDSKIKNKNDMTVDFVCNPDILKGLASKKKSQFLCGFCLETNDIEVHALDKLKRKHLDMMVASLYAEEKNPFGTNLMQPLILFADGEKIEPQPMDKKCLASYLLELVEERVF